MYLLSKDIYKRYLFISTFTLIVKSGCNMQFLYHMHACFLCCPCIKISSLINEKRMTGQERQSCTFHAHISFSVYIVSFFRHPISPWFIFVLVWSSPLQLTCEVLEENKSSRTKRMEAHLWLAYEHDLSWFM